VRDALADTERRLAAAGVPTPRVDAEWLVAHVVGVPRSRLFEAEHLDEHALDELVARRERREPLAYVLGEWGFRGLTLKTDVRALVPRPETETLVERALALIAGEPSPSVLDVGIGSGAIALSIAAEHPGARVVGTDTSRAALELAAENARRLAIKVELRLGGIDVAREGWDLVVSNPPYVRADEWKRLQPEIHNWEPRDALVGEGLHEQLARAAKTRRLVLEVGDGQAAAVVGALSDAGYAGVRITRDLSGVERVVEGRRG
jgi:release factor glutamine methyltransferase